MGTGAGAGLDTMAEDLDALKYDVGELKDLLNNNKGEVNHVRRIVLACERDMEDFTAAMDAVNVDLDEMRARVDATHSIITSRQRVEATTTAEISTMRLDVGDIQEALKNHDSWMEDVSNTLQQMQEKEENLTEEVNGLTVKSASHEVDIQKNSDAVRKMEKQRNMDEQNWKAQMDAVHDVLDTKVNEKPFEDLKHCVASLTKGTVKFAQVVGVFPGPRFDDAEGLDQSKADVELLGWEECAENMSFRVDKAWRQRCSQRFRNILDMIAKKADHSVLRLLQISQQHIESQLERVKHERELWKEVVERRQQQPLQLALSMKEHAAGETAPAPKSARGAISPMSKRIS